uniref:Putative ubiquitin regulatory protein n=1 Tax=Triatoma infestans TaxID=30076 RepID=A0A023EZY3_TRIIF
MTDKIKNFFEKRRREAKFKGQGHRLNETGDPSKSKEPIKLPQERAEPCHEAKQAGLAALARLANKNVHTSVTSFAAQHKIIKKETLLSSGVSSSEDIDETTTDQANYKEFLAVQGVYFKCPLIGPEILPKEEWKNKIKDFLYEQLETEKGFTSCLMIHTLNKNREKVEQCIDTLCTYLQNIISYPDEDKYKKIRVKNKVFQERVSKIIGASEFLESAGFVKELIALQSEEEEFYVFKPTSPDIPHLELMIDTILNTEAIPLELHRNVQVLKPSEAKIMVQLPDDFYALTAEEIKREHKKRAENLESSMQLRTKAMREKEEQREIRKYRYSLIRVRFPDGCFLQGTFGVFEKLGVVRNFVRECISDSIEGFNLTTALGVQLPETEDEKTLVELKLVPAVILTFVPANALPNGQPFLNHDLLQQAA